MVRERLQKLLSRAGVASRRKAEELIAAGRVTVGGEVVREPGTKADPFQDDVRVDGVRLRSAAAPVYLALNKPKGVVATRSDPQRRGTVMDLVPPLPGLFPVGRLDLVTEGLILLTNDGAFAERVAHPRYEVPRVYLAKVRGLPTAAVLERLRRGVTIDGERLAVDRARVLKAENNAWLELRLHEGKHHEVRRLLQAVGHPVAKLKRLAIGPVTTRGLKPGEFRALTVAEIEGLKRGAGPPELVFKLKSAHRPARPGAAAAESGARRQRGGEKRGRTRGERPETPLAGRGPAAGGLTRGGAGTAARGRAGRPLPRTTRRPGPDRDRGSRRGRRPPAR